MAYDGRAQPTATRALSKIERTPHPMASILTRLARSIITRGLEIPGPPNNTTGNAWSDAVAAIFGGRIETASLTTTSEQMGAYSGWVYAAVTTLSTDIRRRPWNLWKDNGEKVERKDIPDILIRPNAQQSWKDITELAMIHLDLTGTAYWHAIKSPGGGVSGFQMIPPNWVTDYRLTKAGALADYQVTVPGRHASWRSGADVYLMRWPHPEDPYSGASPVQAFAHSYNVDLYARAYTSSILRNNAQVPGILSTDQELNPEQADTIRERWLQRYGKGGGTAEGPAVLGKGVQYTQMSMSIKDLAFAELANLSMEQIFAIYSLPPSKAGLSRKGGTLAMSREESNTYAENAVVPRLDKIEDAVERFILPMAQLKGIEFRYENPIKADVEAEHKRAGEALSKGTITLNQYLEETSREALGDEGNVYYLPLGIRIVDKIETLDPYAAIAPPPPGEATPLPAAESEDDSASRGEAKVGESIAPETVLNGAQVTSKVSDERMELSAIQFRQVQAKAEAGLKAETRRLFSKESSLIIAGVKAQLNEEKHLYDKAEGWGMQLVKGQLLPVFIVRGLGDDIVEAALAETQPAWANGLESAWLSGQKQGWELLLADGVGAENVLSFNVYQEAAIEAARVNAAEKVKRIHRVTRDRLKPLIAESIERGDSIAQLTDEISGEFNQFKGFRSETIARTEAADAVNEGKFQHAKTAEKELGLEMRKTWNPALGDERTRAHHRASAIMPTQTVGLNQDFIVNGEKMSRPLDSRGSAGNVIRCRCVLTMEVI